MLRAEEAAMLARAHHHRRGRIAGCRCRGLARSCCAATSPAWAVRRKPRSGFIADAKGLEKTLMARAVSAANRRAGELASGSLSSWARGACHGCVRPAPARRACAGDLQDLQRRRRPMTASSRTPGTGTDPGHAKDTIMASGRIGLMVNLNEDALTWYDGERYSRRNRIPGIALCGTHSAHFAIDAFQASNMGVQFKPGGAFAFFGGSARDFANRAISRSRPSGAGMRTACTSVSSRRQRRRTRSRSCSARWWSGTATRERHPAVALALARFARAPHRTSVRAIAREAEISAKRLIHLFAEQVGMTPKLYLRVSRFQRVLATASTRRRTWTGWEEVESITAITTSRISSANSASSPASRRASISRLRGPYLQHVPLMV